MATDSRCPGRAKAVDTVHGRVYAPRLIPNRDVAAMVNEAPAKPRPCVQVTDASFRQIFPCEPAERGHGENFVSGYACSGSI